MPCLVRNVVCMRAGLSYSPCLLQAEGLGALAGATGVGISPKIFSTGMCHSSMTLRRNRAQSPACPMSWPAMLQAQWELLPWLRPSPSLLCCCTTHKPLLRPSQSALTS